MQLLLRSVRAALWSQPDDGLGRLVEEPVDWPVFHAAAVANKLGVLVIRGLALSSAELAGPQAGVLEGFRKRTLQVNGINLITVREVVPALSTAGVETLLIKGPVHQKELYGNYFIRPSGDVDLLVRRDQFDEAARLLEVSGYFRPAEGASLWWKLFLGEQPFLSTEGRRSTIDLHHRTQQPGCPAPRLGDVFFQRGEAKAVGGAKVAVMAKADAALLACMSLAKALSHREAAGSFRNTAMSQA